MLKIPVYNLQGKEIEKIELSPVVFRENINKSLLAQAIRVYLANKRQGTASSKTRGEVDGSTRKIYKQKGTGRARHGSIRAPIFRKGGIVFGPKPREYRLELPKKMRDIALYSALGSKLQEKSIFVVDGLEKIKQKTKEIVRVLNNLKMQPEKEKIILALDGRQDNVFRAGRNLENTIITDVKNLNTYDVLNSSKILFTKNAVINFPSKKPRKQNSPETKDKTKKKKIPEKQKLKEKPNNE